MKRVALAGINSFASANDESYKKYAATPHEQDILLSHPGIEEEISTAERV
jgi:hypothetical protein